MQSNVPQVSIVIPCFRDEDNIRTLLERLEPTIASIAGGAEVVLVDDGSPDLTGDRAIEEGARYPHPVTVVRLARNFGQHPAVFAGLAAARGSVVVTCDSDLQYPPDQIPVLLAALDDRHPVASGYREDRKDPLSRRMLTRLLTGWLGRRTGQELRDYGSMFRAYKRPVVDAMLQITEQHRFVPAIPSWLGFRVKEVPVQHAPRGEQGSRYRLSSLASLFLDLVTSYAVSPLRALSGVAALAAFLGFVATLAFTIYRIVLGDGVSGTVSAFALIFFLLAIQLLVLALMSEYVGRIFVETKRRPYYVVRSTVVAGGSRDGSSGRLLESFQSSTTEGAQL